MAHNSDIEPLIFPDILINGEDASSAFFELANASQIAYRLSSLAIRRSATESANELTPQSNMLVINQDVSACLQHTGGIVWETCYLLLTYLTAASSLSDAATTFTPLGNVLEVGAGCGLLGQGLAVVSSTKRVVLSECLEAFENLDANVQRNRDTLLRQAPNVNVSCCILDWLHLERDIATNSNLLGDPLDTIVGTDVLFSPRLVCPLLRTLQRLSHAHTTIYLCVQVRCALSHSMLLEKASDFDLRVEDISENVYGVAGCEWGREMECLVLRLSRVR